MHACASRPELSRGRLHAESPDAARNEFQRDRDRIVHSTAFRRLVYKTQVFLNHEGDLFRTRMTHSLEVAQVGRSIARSVGLHEDLVEAISLAHDLGHTPFGHAGQDALDECMRMSDPESSGFEHNLQSLRVVDELEERYPTYDGLNLSFETREGILKHCSRRNAERLERMRPGDVGQRFLDRTRPSLEAQLCNVADEIAYNAHDIDDGVRSGLLALTQLREVRIFERTERLVLTDHPALSGRRLLFEVIRRMLSEQIYDVVATTLATLSASAARSADEVRQLPALVSFSPAMQEQAAELKRLLRTELYHHPQVVANTEQAKEVVRDLFDAYLSTPSEMPPSSSKSRSLTRRVADHVAGMTDRYALREHHRLTGRRLFDQHG